MSEKYDKEGWLTANALRKIMMSSIIIPNEVEDFTKDSEREKNSPIETYIYETNKEPLEVKIKGRNIVDGKTNPGIGFFYVPSKNKIIPCSDHNPNGFFEETVYLCDARHHDNDNDNTVTLYSMNGGPPLFLLLQTNKIVSHGVNPSKHYPSGHVLVQEGNSGIGSLLL